jgi:hypothetical protein
MHMAVMSRVKRPAQQAHDHAPIGRWKALNHLPCGLHLTKAQFQGQLAPMSTAIGVEEARPFP